MGWEAKMMDEATNLSAQACGYVRYRVMGYPWFFGATYKYQLELMVIRMIFI